MRKFGFAVFLWVGLIQTVAHAQLPREFWEDLRDPIIEIAEQHGVSPSVATEALGNVRGLDLHLAQYEGFAWPYNVYQLLHQNTYRQELSDELVQKGVSRPTAEAFVREFLTRIGTSLNLHMISNGQPQSKNLPNNRELTPSERAIVGYIRSGDRSGLTEDSPISRRLALYADYVSSQNSGLPSFFFGSFTREKQFDFAAFRAAVIEARNNWQGILRGLVEPDVADKLFANALVYELLREGGLTQRMPSSAEHALLDAANMGTESVLHTIDAESEGLEGSMHWLARTAKASMKKTHRLTGYSHDGQVVVGRNQEASKTALDLQRYSRRPDVASAATEMVRDRPVPARRPDASYDPSPRRSPVPIPVPSAEPQLPAPRSVQPPAKPKNSLGASVQSWFEGALHSLRSWWDSWRTSKAKPRAEEPQRERIVINPREGIEPYASDYRTLKSDMANDITRHLPRAKNDVASASQLTAIAGESLHRRMVERLDRLDLNPNADPMEFLDGLYQQSRRPDFFPGQLLFIISSNGFTKELQGGVHLSFALALKRYPFHSWIRAKSLVNALAADQSSFKERIQSELQRYFMPRRESVRQRLSEIHSGDHVQLMNAKSGTFVYVDSKLQAEYEELAAEIELADRLSPRSARDIQRSAIPPRGEASNIPDRPPAQTRMSEAETVRAYVHPDEVRLILRSDEFNRYVADLRRSDPAMADKIQRSFEGFVRSSAGYNQTELRDITDLVGRVREAIRVRR